MAEEQGLHFVATIDNKEFMRSISDIRDAVQKTSQLLEQAARNTDKAGEKGVEAARETDKAIGKVDDTVRKLNDDVKKSSDGFGKLTKLAAGFFTLQAAQGFAQKVFAVRSEIESLQTSFRTLVGDKDKADALFQGIKEFAVSTPMQMKDLASAAQTMLGFGLPLEQIMQNLKAIGDVSGGDTQRFQALSLAFSQVSAAGKLMGQDLMQMINAGFNPLAVMAEKTGKSIGQLKDEMSKGAITADMVRQAFIDATSEGGQFFGMLEAQSKTLAGAYSNLKGAIDDMLNSIGEKTEGVFTKAIDAATVLAKNYEAVGTAIIGLITTYGAYKAAVMVATAVESGYTVVEALHLKLLIAQEKVQKLLNDTILKNPYVAAAVALGILVTAIGTYIVGSRKADEATQDLNKAFADTQAEISTEQKKIDELFGKLRNAKKGTDEYKSAKDAIISQYGGYLSGLSAEVTSLGNVEAAYRAVSAAARDAAMARGMEAALAKNTEAYNETYSENYDKIYNAISENYGQDTADKLMKDLAANLRRDRLLKLEDVEFFGRIKGVDKRWLYRLSLNESNYDKANQRVRDKFGNPEPPKNPAAAPAATTPSATATKTKTKAAKVARDTNKAVNAAVEAEEKATAIIERQQEERAQAAREMELAIRQAQIDAMEEGTEKALAQIELDYNREKEAIRKGNEELRRKRIDQAKALWDADPKNKGKNFYTSQSYKDASETSYTAEELRYNEAVEALAEKTRARSRERIARENAEALSNYLKEYGTYEQKRLAITEETERKIAEAKNTGGKLAAMAQGRKALQDLARKQEEKAIDWESIFGDLSLYTAEELEKFKKALREKLGKEGLQLDEYKTIVERIDSINDAIISDHEREKGFLAKVISTGRERKKLELDILEAKEQQAAAEKRLEDANAKVTVATYAARQIARRAGYDGIEQAQGMSADNPLYDDFIKALDSLNAAITEQTDATDANTEAQKKVDTSQRRRDNYGKNDLIPKDTMEVLRKISSNIQSLPDLVEQLGIDENSGLGKAAANIAETAGNAMGAIEDFQNGNFVGAAAKTVGALTSLGKTIFGDPAAELAETIERLTAANESLEKAVAMLAEDMKDATLLEAAEIYERQIKYLEQSAANTKRLIQDSLDASSSGFLGIGSKSSTGAEISGGLSEEEWRRISEITETSVTDADEFFRLTQEQLHDVMKYAPDVWAHIKELADDGMGDVAQFMDEYAESWDAIDKATDAFREKLTSTTFESVYSNFRSLISDMDSDAHDFGENFEKYMYDALLNAKLEESFKKDLTEWYGDFAKAMNSNGLDSDEIESLRGRWMKMTAEAKAASEEIRKLTGYTGASSEGSATYSAVKSFTQEQGDILNGRLTAIQIGVRENNIYARQIAASLQSLASVMTGGTAVEEIRNMMITTNSYLDDVARYTKKIYDDFGMKMDEVTATIKKL